MAPSALQQPAAATISAQLISHITHFRDGEWNPEVLRRIELCLLDNLACFSVGFSLKHFAPSAAVAGRLFAVNSPFALAYIYGQAANALDFDDTLLDHPGSPIVGAVLAIAARDRLSTDRLLRGIAAAYDIAFIMGASAMPSRERATLVRSVGVWDTIAAALGAGVALGLDDQVLERLLSVAVAHSLLPYTAKWYERPAPAVKNNLGWAAAGAVLAVDLTLAGQTGITNALDGDAGMWRMAGSDCWSWDSSLLSKPAVLRTGFKPFPVCWHLQQYHKVLSDLLLLKAADDDIIEIVLAAPEDAEKFCPKEVYYSTDMATSLSLSFSLLIAGVEPGPAWGSPDGHGRALRYADRFRYERSETRSILLRTLSGSVLTREVVESEIYDRSTFGLDEAGVLAKHERWTDAGLRAGVGNALAARKSSTGSIPDQLYSAISSMMLNLTQPREIERN